MHFAHHSDYYSCEHIYTNIVCALRAFRSSFPFSCAKTSQYRLLEHYRRYSNVSLCIVQFSCFCEFESKENIYLCHYLARNAFTVKLTSNSSNYSNRKKTKHRAVGCEWNGLPKREESALFHVYKVHTTHTVYWLTPLHC